jgi:hypothetical protein
MNHFHKWTPHYRGLTPPVLDPARERELVALEDSVGALSPLSHAMWAMWGLIQVCAKTLRWALLNPTLIKLATPAAAWL